MIYKKIIRKVLRARDNESIRDAFLRNKIKIDKHIYKNRYEVDELQSILVKAGIKNGDALLVHCSWRNMYNFVGTPNDVIDLLQRIVGKSGTLLMPSYGEDRYFFDMDNSPSAAGVLSEVFRKTDGVVRSACTHFSVAGIGNDIDYLLSEHRFSQYGFDQYSPCYKLALHPHGKVLFLGLGREPTKISIFHCAGALLRNSDFKLQKLLSNTYESVLVNQGQRINKLMYIRQPGHKNNNRVFKQIFRQIDSKSQIKISNLDVVVIDAREALEKALQFASEGKYIYKNMSKL